MLLSATLVSKSTNMAQQRMAMGISDFTGVTVRVWVVLWECVANVWRDRRQTVPMMGGSFPCESALSTCEVQGVQSHPIIVEGQYFPASFTFLTCCPHQNQSWVSNLRSNREKCQAHFTHGLEQILVMEAGKFKWIWQKSVISTEASLFVDLMWSWNSLLPMCK